MARLKGGIQRRGAFGGGFGNVFEKREEKQKNDWTIGSEKRKMDSPENIREEGVADFKGVSRLKDKS